MLFLLIVFETQLLAVGEVLEMAPKPPSPCGSRMNSSAVTPPPLLLLYGSTLFLLPLWDTPFCLVETAGCASTLELRTHPLLENLEAVSWANFWFRLALNLERVLVPPDAAPSVLLSTQVCGESCYYKLDSFHHQMLWCLKICSAYLSQDAPSCSPENFWK